MADAALEEADQGSAHSPLVFVSFQKDEQRKFKFLEGEPKALGITQLCMSIFHISCVASLLAANMIKTGLEIPSIISSLLIAIAGSLAIAAKNLHLPTLRACLGMEVVAAGASFFNLIATLTKLLDFRLSCYGYSKQQKMSCHDLEQAHTHLFAELLVIQVALFAISITLVVYAAKVAKCCSPSPKVPVITIQAPVVSQ